MVKRIGVVFPGYGEQRVGMGKELYDQSRIVQEFFEQAADSLGVNFVKLCFASSAQNLASIDHGYTALYLFECALYDLLRRQGLKPDFIAGYGIGEYAACYGAQSLSFIDGLYFLNKYAQLYADFIKQHKHYTVLRITRGFSQQSLQEVIDTLATPEYPAFIAARNGNGAFYVAGSSKTIRKLQAYCKKQVIRKVKVVGPVYELHGSLVSDLAQQLLLYYHKIQFKALQTPIITNVDGVYVTTADALQSAMMRKIDHPVVWDEVMQGFVDCDIIISVGPGKQLIEWFKQVYPDKQYVTVLTLKDIAKVVDLCAENMQQPSGQVPDLPTNLYEADLLNELPTDFDDESQD